MAESGRYSIIFSTSSSVILSQAGAGQGDHRTRVEMERLAWIEVLQAKPVSVDHPKGLRETSCPLDDVLGTHRLHSRSEVACWRWPAAAAFTRRCARRGSARPTCRPAALPKPGRSGRRG